ncbi:MAG TPA: hypothetical protein VHO67_03340 [Polyangia bacterium]|nr:hypothetical protein [Polyangia bacterium]
MLQPPQLLLSLWKSCATQALPLQQPFVHEAAVHEHAPALQVWPLPQVLHAAPAVPQVSGAEGWHTPLPSQHPFGQEVALQTQAPPLHVCPVPHGAQALPPLPHVVGPCPLPVTQVFPLQQPVGQEVASQTHAPEALQV